MGLVNHSRCCLSFARGLQGRLIGISFSTGAAILYSFLRIRKAKVVTCYMGCSSQDARAEGGGASFVTAFFVLE